MSLTISASFLSRTDTPHFLRSRYYNFTWRKIIQMIYKLTDLPTMVCGRSSSGIRGTGWPNRRSFTSTGDEKNEGVYSWKTQHAFHFLLRVISDCDSRPSPCIFKRQSFTWFKSNYILTVGIECLASYCHGSWQFKNQLIIV